MRLALVIGMMAIASSVPPSAQAQEFALLEHRYEQPAIAGVDLRTSEEAPSRVLLPATYREALYEPLIRQAEVRYRLPPGLMQALVWAESRFNPMAISPAGATGLAQLMPATARELGVRNRHDPAQNIDGGARYLRQMLDRFGGLDILFNNAGIMRRNALEDLNLMTMREQYEVNSLAPLRVTAALMDRLSEGSKVAMVTSRMGSIADNDSGSHYGYRMSKAALNMGAKSLSLDLSPRGIAVCVLHPGWVRTDMTRGNGLIDADESAAGLMARIDGLTMENTGSFWHSNGDELPW